MPKAEEKFKNSALAEKGFFILPSELFECVKEQAKTDQNINQTLKNIFDNIQNRTVGTYSEKAFKGLFADLDPNSQKLGANRYEKLNEILNKIGSLQLGNGNYSDNSIDLFGSAYEYLMKMYAGSAGKSGGEFYTPQEVAELLAKITLVGKTSVNKVYDPACGSGGLLLQFAKIIGKDNVKDGFYGQEINLTTYNLCRFNMFLHDLDYSQFNIAYGDTLIRPEKEHLNKKPFEAIVSNPPYSVEWNDLNMLNDDRFAAPGITAPKSKADFAFILHGLAWLAPSGIAAYVVFPGILYRKGAEQKIRQYLINENVVDCVIQLPPDLFFGVTISTCILVLKRGKMNTTDVLFINAEAEFVRTDSKNVLQSENITKILDAYTERKDIPHFARLVPQQEISDNDYNLSVSSYVEAQDLRQQIDIRQLNREIDSCVAKQSKLRRQLNQVITDLSA